ncbi:MAG: hypothetical protein MH219_00335 [Marinobacter sp.]|nr:hypothetical protein [Marinobacter sp.]
MGAWGAGFLVDGIDTSAAFLGSAVVTALAFATAWRGLQPPPQPDT